MAVYLKKKYDVTVLALGVEHCRLLRIYVSITLKNTINLHTELKKSVHIGIHYRKTEYWCCTKSHTKTIEYENKLCFVSYILEN